MFKISKKSDTILRLLIFKKKVFFARIKSNKGRMEKEKFLWIIN